MQSESRRIVNARDFQDWTSRAFLLVEAALAAELATPSRVCMTEDYYRSSFVRGMAQSRPEYAERVTSEQNAGWSNAGCWNNLAHVPGNGRPIQHDVAVSANADDAGLICEVKWLKARQAGAVAKDIWKLALSRSVTAEGQSVRTYLLIGGESEAFSGTLRSLRRSGIDLRWRNAAGQAAPATREASLEAFANTVLGRDSLRSLLSWGSAPKHFRTPPACWDRVRITRRVVPWLRTIDNLGWRAVLWELHHHGASTQAHVNWNVMQQNMPFTC
jgi:hypothetical protein